MPCQSLSWGAHSVRHSFLGSGSFFLESFQMVVIKGLELAAAKYTLSGDFGWLVGTLYVLFTAYYSFRLLACISLLRPSIGPEQVICSSCSPDKSGGVRAGACVPHAWRGLLRTVHLHCLDRVPALLR